MIDPLIPLVISTALALLFFTAARHKLVDGPRFTAQLAAYELVPTAWLKPVGRTLPWLEMALSLALLVPATRMAAGAIAAALLTAYALAMAVNLWRGRQEIDCGCGGAPQAISGWLLLRNAALVAGALSLSVPAAARGLSMLDILFAVVFTAVLCLSYIMLEQLSRNYSLLGK